MSEEKTKKEVKVPEKFKGLVEQIEKLSVLDLAELVKVLEKKFGVKIPDEKATTEAFDSVNNIMDLLKELNVS